MNEKYRFLTTATIWIAMAAVLIILFASLLWSNVMLDETGLILLASFVLTFIVTAGIATGLVWRGAGQQETVVNREARKAKRSLERLVEVLDEDEIIELEALMASRLESESNSGHEV
ncbi:MAG: hypothetical protein Kow0077_01150 [Anaerolineae bacterium]